MALHGMHNTILDLNVMLSIQTYSRGWNKVTFAFSLLRLLVHSREVYGFKFNKRSLGSRPQHLLMYNTSD